MISDPSFLGVPDVDIYLFVGLSVASFFTTLIGALTGTIGGLLMLGILSLFFPPVVLIPVHTVAQLGVSCTRAFLMWKWVMRGALPPFILGAILGATVGAQLFVVLSEGWLQAAIGGFILLFTWMPQFASAGADRLRFGVLGFVATFLGMFVSATGTMLSPFVAASSPDRRNHVSTFASMMFFVHLCKLTAFLALGVAVADYLPLILSMIAMAFCANWAGSKGLDRIPEKMFRLVFKVLLTALALRLAWKGLSDLGYI